MDGRAANSGDPDSMFQLAVMYSRGIGVAADNAEALRWLALAAERGSPDAQYTMGQLRASEGDPEQAVQWLRRAVGQGHRPAAEFLAAMCGRGIATACG